MKVRLTLKGVTPLLQHNERLSDPLDPHTQALAKVTGKRKKTIEDHEEISRLEFLGGIYWSETSGPYVPGRWVRKCMAEAGTIDRKGTAIERGLQVLTFEAPILYQGPRSVAELWGKQEQYATRLSVGLGVGAAKKRTQRTRPSFMPWAIEAEVLIDPTIIDFEQVAHTAEVAGRLIGLGDGRRIGYGRFEALTEKG